MLSPGTRIDRYELLTRIGEGGMADVWAARQDGLHGFSKLFALKIIHPSLAEQADFRRMFLDEARLAASIEHPHVAQVFDRGEHEEGLYLVMEYVDGESLSTMLGAIRKPAGEVARVPLGAALRITADVCGGLHAAHKLVGPDGNLRGVVHRDVSPHNVLLSSSGDVKLIDFGVAFTEDPGRPKTGVDALKGKLRYMAPEQATKQKLGPYTDVYAAGALLYRMLAGRAPFEAETDILTLQRLLSGEPPAPLPDSVPALASAIVMRALSFDPGDRHESAAAMQRAIEHAIAEQGLAPELAKWIRPNLTERYHARRKELESRGLVTPKKAVPELEIVPELEAPPFPSLALQESDALPPVGETPLEIKITRPPGAAPVNDIRSFAAAATTPYLDEPARSFMDLKAIAAKTEEPPVADGDSVAPQEAAPGKTSTRKAPGRMPASDRRRVPKAALGVAGAVVLLVGIAILAAPAIVKGRIIAAAGAAGIDLTIDRISVGLSGITLGGVHAKIPGAAVAVNEVFVSGLKAERVIATGIEASLNGRLDALLASAARVHEGSRASFGPPGTDGPGRRISFVGAHATWVGPFGEGTKIEAGDIGVELETKPSGAEEIKSTIGRFEVKTPRTLLGPWSASIEHAGRSTRARLVFDPPVPDGPSATYVWGQATAPRFTIKIPRTPFAQIGMKPAELGLPADAKTEVAILLEGGQNPNARVEASAKIELWGARLKGFKQPIDLRVEGSGSGSPGKSVDFERAIATVGPFTALLSGSVTPHAKGLRVDAGWKTQPIPCERLARAEAKSFGVLAETIQEIGQSTGALRVTGTAYASGRLSLDTASPEQASLTYQARETCGLSLFGL